VASALLDPSWEVEVERSERGGRHPRILVIEDDNGIARGVRALLASRGIEVVLATGAEEALRHGVKGDLTLVVADFDLGGADGLEIIRELRAMRPGLPVLAVTAVDRPRAAVAARELGIAELFEKPADPEALVEAVIRRILP
jgi:two-component system response regulator RegA